MATIRHSLQKEVFDITEEKLIGILHVTKPGKKKKKISFLCAAINKEKPVCAFIHQVKETDKDSFKKKNSWPLFELQLVDGKDENKETAELDLTIDRVYKWVASSVPEKQSFIHVLWKLCCRYLPKQKPQFINVPLELLKDDVVPIEGKVDRTPGEIIFCSPLFISCQNHYKETQTETVFNIDKFICLPNSTSVTVGSQPNVSSIKRRKRETVAEQILRSTNVYRSQDISSLYCSDIIGESHVVADYNGILALQNLNSSLDKGHKFFRLFGNKKSMLTSKSQCSNAGKGTNETYANVFDSQIMQFQDSKVYFLENDMTNGNKSCESDNDSVIVEEISYLHSECNNSSISSSSIKSSYSVESNDILSHENGDSSHIVLDKMPLSESAQDTYANETVDKSESVVCTAKKELESETYEAEREWEYDAYDAEEEWEAEAYAVEEEWELDALEADSEWEADAHEAESEWEWEANYEEALRLEAEIKAAEIEWNGDAGGENIRDYELEIQGIENEWEYDAEAEAELEECENNWDEMEEIENKFQLKCVAEPEVASKYLKFQGNVRGEAKVEIDDWESADPEKKVLSSGSGLLTKGKVEGQHCGTKSGNWEVRESNNPYWEVEESEANAMQLDSVEVGANIKQFEVQLAAESYSKDFDAYMADHLEDENLDDRDCDEWDAYIFADEYYESYKDFFGNYEEYDYDDEEWDDEEWGEDYHEEWDEGWDDQNIPVNEEDWDDQQGFVGGAVIGGMQIKKRRRG